MCIQTKLPRMRSGGCRNDRLGATTFVPGTPRDSAAFSCGTGFYPYFSLSRSNLPPKLCMTCQIFDILIFSPLRSRPPERPMCVADADPPCVQNCVFEKKRARGPPRCNIKKSDFWPFASCCTSKMRRSGQTLHHECIVRYGHHRS